MYQDSTGRPITVGNRVRFRGQEYTIKAFRYGLGTIGTATIEFEESDVHTTEVPDEISVDLLAER